MQIRSRCTWDRFPSSPSVLACWPCPPGTWWSRPSPRPSGSCTGCRWGGPCSGNDWRKPSNYLISSRVLTNVQIYFQFVYMKSSKKMNYKVIEFQNNNRIDWALSKHFFSFSILRNLSSNKMTISVHISLYLTSLTDKFLSTKLKVLVQSYCLLLIFWTILVNQLDCENTWMLY